MKPSKGYTAKPLDFDHRMLIASVNGNKKNAIHCVTKVDVTRARKLRNKYFEETREKLSFTACILKCFAEAIREFPEMNAFIKGNKLIILEYVYISVLIEREIEGKKIPEPLGLKKLLGKNLHQIHKEIRAAKKCEGRELGELSGASWVRFIPGFLMRRFIRIADQNIRMASRYGKLAVTTVSIYAEEATWFIPHGAATVMLTTGSLGKEHQQDEKGKLQEREMLHLTASFDHEIIDRAPAARFMSLLNNLLQEGDCLASMLEEKSG